VVYQTTLNNKIIKPFSFTISVWYKPYFINLYRPWHPSFCPSLVTTTALVWATGRSLARSCSNLCSAPVPVAVAPVASKKWGRPSFQRAAGPMTRVQRSADTRRRRGPGPKQARRATAASTLSSYIRAASVVTPAPPPGAVTPRDPSKYTCRDPLGHRPRASQRIALHCSPHPATSTGRLPAPQPPRPMRHRHWCLPAATSMALARAPAGQPSPLATPAACFLISHADRGCASDRSIDPSIAAGRAAGGAWKRRWWTSWWQSVDK
jgi:hypothetical protein